MRSDSSRLLLRVVGVLFGFLVAGFFSWLAIPFLSASAVFVATLVLTVALCSLPLRGMVGGASVVFGVVALVVGSIYAVIFFDGMAVLFYLLFLLCCYSLSCALRGR